jgi:hypothetical protein
VIKKGNDCQPTFGFNRKGSFKQMLLWPTSTAELLETHFSVEPFFWKINSLADQRLDDSADMQKLETIYTEEMLESSKKWALRVRRRARKQQMFWVGASGLLQAGP